MTRSAEYWKRRAEANMDGVQRGAEQRLARKAQEEAVRYLDVLTPEAQAAREKLEKARTFLAGYPKLTDRLSTAAKAKRVNEHTNPAHKWVALAIVLAGLIAAVYGVIAWRRQEGFGMYFTLLGLAVVFLFSGTQVIPTMRNNKRAVAAAWEHAACTVKSPSENRGKGEAAHRERGEQRNPVSEAFL